MRAESAGDGVDAGAVIDGIYRYHLYRAWPSASLLDMNGSVLWIMLNPSTATDTQLDPTLRRCLGYTQAWGFSRMDICNLFAYRSTSPEAMLDAAKSGIDIVGPRNDEYIIHQAAEADLVMCGWGKDGNYAGRAKHVMDLIRDWTKLHALNTNIDGSPCHPLYLRSDLKPKPYGG